MKLLKTVDMVDVTELSSISFFVKKTGSEISINEQLAKELHNQQLKKSKKEKYMRDLKIIFRQQA